MLNILADRNSWFHSRGYMYTTTAPILVPIVVIFCLFIIIYSPWRNVIRPVSQSKFNADIKRIHMKVLHIGRFKICYDKTAKMINKFFFVWTEKGT
jgi:hypothetical protein